MVTRNGATTRVEAGEKLELNQKVEKEKATTELTNYYRPRFFNCDNTPLPKLVEVVNREYDTTIVIRNPALLDIRIKSTYDNKSVNEIVDNIIEINLNTHAITKEIKGDTIILK